MSRAIFAAAIVASAAGLASAGTITGRFNNASHAVALNVTAGSNTQSFNVGALRHTWSAGSNAEMQRLEGQYSTFCIDYRNAASVNDTYTLRDITEAPETPQGNPITGAQYTNDQKMRVAAVVAAAQSLNRMGSRGEFLANGTDDNIWGAAIQLAVWESLWEGTIGAGWDLNAGSFRLNSTGGPSSNPTKVRNAFTVLTNLAATAFGPSPTLNFQMGVRALTAERNGGATNEDIQDQLIVIPLPPAAWAGLASMAGVVGFGYIRRRNLRAG